MLEGVLAALISLLLLANEKIVTMIHKLFPVSSRASFYPAWGMLQKV